MGFYRTDDPHADFDRHEAEREAELQLLPICCECGERIMDERCFVFFDEPMHIDCADKYKKYTVDLMG